MIETTTILNVNHPGQVKRLDAKMYEAMKRAFLNVLPKRSPALTAAEVRKRVIDYLPEKLVPGGAKAGWWAKTVQLDVAARGVVAREKINPQVSAKVRDDMAVRVESEWPFGH